MLESNLKVVIFLQLLVVQQMIQEKTNSFTPGAPMIVVKQLTNKILTEAIETYVVGEGYWL
jgi:hypothetical protein